MPVNTNMINEQYFGSGTEAKRFRARVQLFAVQVAGNVLDEAASVTHHNQRAAFAVRVINDPSKVVDSIIWVLVADYLDSLPADSSDVTDNQLGVGIAASWNHMSGSTTPFTG